MGNAQPARAPGRRSSATVLLLALAGLGLGAGSVAAAAEPSLATRPAAPSAVHAVTSSGAVTVSWTASAGGPTVSAFQVRCTSTDGGPALSGRAPAPARTLRLSGLPAGRTYACTVVAVSPAGTSAPGTSPYVLHGQVGPGRTATLHLPVVVGQEVSAVLAATTVPAGDCTASVVTYDPQGQAMQSACGGAGTFVDAGTPRTAGTATVVGYSPAGPGSMDLVAYVFRDLRRPVPLGRAGTTVTLDVPGRSAALTFAGTSGQQVTLATLDSTIGTGSVQLLAPGRVQPLVFQPLDGQDHLPPDAVTLRADATYTVLVDPGGAALGRVTVQVVVLPRNEQPILADGPPVTATVQVPRQNPVLTFPGRAGQRVSAVISRDTIGAGELRLELPDGTPAGSTFLARNPSTGFLDTTALPVDGTYRLVVDPSRGHLGHVTVQLFAVPVDNGPITVGAPAQTIRLTRPGSDARRTFSGHAGQRITVTVTDNTVPGVAVYLTDDEGRDLDSNVYATGPSASTRPVTLPRDGTYVVVVDPAVTFTGSLSVRVHG